MIWDDEEAEAEQLIAPAPADELPTFETEVGEPDLGPSHAPMADYPEIDAAPGSPDTSADALREASAARAHAPVDPAMEELAARLERLAAALRNRGIAAIAGVTSTDSLALLVAGFALGTMQRPRER